MSTEQPAVIHEAFRKFAHWSADVFGSVTAFVIACAVIVIWAATGPMFGFSDTWQLIINTGTTVVTFLMVFLLQSTQNRDAKATQVKLDELIHAVETAHNRLIAIEDRSDEELAKAREELAQIAESSRDSRQASCDAD